MFFRPEVDFKICTSYIVRDINVNSLIVKKCYNINEFANTPMKMQCQIINQLMVIVISGLRLIKSKKITHNKTWELSFFGFNID